MAEQKASSAKEHVTAFDCAIWVVLSTRYLHAISFRVLGLHMDLEVVFPSKGDVAGVALESLDPIVRV